MKLESGPAAYDRNYYLIFLILCLGLGGYFLYDFKIGYPNKNREHAQKQLTPLLGADYDVSALPLEPTKPIFTDLVKSKPATAAAIHEKLGDPLTIRPSETGETVEYFVSLYGMGVVPVLAGKPDLEKANWITWNKTKEEIALQFWCALICFAVALYVLSRVYRAARLRAVIDDEGMTYGAKRIAFASMDRLCDYSPKGWVDLYYKHGPQERKLRIDNQKIRKFHEIIDALCEAKGFEDPRGAGEEPAKEAEAGSAAASADASEAPAESGSEDKPTDAG
jgi:hypothetical protein